MKCREVIETKRLRLRRLERRDFLAIVAALNDWSIAQWLAIPPYPYTCADAEAFLGLTKEADANGFNGKYIVADHDSDQLLGVLTLSQDGGRAELGYWLSNICSRAGLYDRSGANVADGSLQVDENDRHICYHGPRE